MKNVLIMFLLILFFVVGCSNNNQDENISGNGFMPDSNHNMVEQNNIPLNEGNNCIQKCMINFANHTNVSFLNFNNNFTRGTGDEMRGPKDAMRPEMDNLNPPEELPLSPTKMQQSDMINQPERPQGEMQPENQNVLFPQMKGNNSFNNSWNFFWNSSWNSSSNSSYNYSELEVKEICNQICFNIDDRGIKNEIY